LEKSVTDCQASLGSRAVLELPSKTVEKGLGSTAAAHVKRAFKKRTSGGAIRKKRRSGEGVYSPIMREWGGGRSDAPKVLNFPGLVLVGFEKSGDALANPVFGRKPGREAALETSVMTRVSRSSTSGQSAGDLTRIKQGKKTSGETKRQLVKST